MSHLIFYALYLPFPALFFLFFFNDTATTEIYTLSLHDALPISIGQALVQFPEEVVHDRDQVRLLECVERSEEHTSELQSLAYLVCRLLLEKKKKKQPVLLYSQLTL